LQGWLANVLATWTTKLSNVSSGSPEDRLDAMVCLMNIGNEQVQCQEFDVLNDKVGEDFYFEN
jgi:hypothetical protein